MHRRIHYSFHLKVISEFSRFVASTSFKFFPSWLLLVSSNTLGGPSVSDLLSLRSVAPVKHTPMLWLPGEKNITQHRTIYGLALDDQPCLTWHRN